MNNLDEFLNESTFESEQLPSIARTRSGIEYKPNEVRWKFYDGNALVNINFNSVPELTQPLVFGLKTTLIWMLENRSPLTTRVYFFKFLSLLRVLVIGRADPIKQLTAQDIHNVRSASRKAELDLSSTIYLLKQWHSLGVRGVGKEVADLLDQITIKGNDSGTNVTVMHPRKGPFTNLEFEAIQDALNDAYGASNWVKHQSTTLERLDQLCELLDNPAIPIGSVIQPTGIVPASRLAQAAERRLAITGKSQIVQQIRTLDDARALLVDQTSA